MRLDIAKASYPEQCHQPTALDHFKIDDGFAK